VFQIKIVENQHCGYALYKQHQQWKKVTKYCRKSWGKEAWGV